MICIVVVHIWSNLPPAKQMKKKIIICLEPVLWIVIGLVFSFPRKEPPGRLEQRISWLLKAVALKRNSFHKDNRKGYLRNQLYLDLPKVKGKKLKKFILRENPQRILFKKGSLGSWFPVIQFSVQLSKH